MSVFPVPVEANVVAVPLTGLLFASRSVIVTVEVVDPFAVTPELGEAEIVEFAATAVPATKLTVPSAFVNGLEIERVFVSALVERKVQVETPEVLLEEHAP